MANRSKNRPHYFIHLLFRLINVTLGGHINLFKAHKHKVIFKSFSGMSHSVPLPLPSFFKVGYFYLSAPFISPCFLLTKPYFIWFLSCTFTMLWRPLTLPSLFDRYVSKSKPNPFTVTTLCRQRQKIENINQATTQHNRTRRNDLLPSKALT